MYRLHELNADAGRYTDGMLRLSLRQNDAASALAYARKSVEQSPSLRQSSGLSVLRDDDLAQGRASDAAERYKTAYPEVFEATPLINRRNYDTASDIAYLLLKMGRESAAKTLLEIAKCVRVLSRTTILRGSDPGEASLTNFRSFESCSTEIITRQYCCILTGCHNAIQ